MIFDKISKSYLKLHSSVKKSLEILSYSLGLLKMYELYGCQKTILEFLFICYIMAKMAKNDVSKYI